MGIRHALKIALQRLRGRHIEYHAFKHALAVLKLPQFRSEFFNPKKFKHFQAVFDHAQGEHIADYGQRRTLALVCLHHAAALALLAQQRHTGFRGGGAVGFDALHDVRPLLPVKVAFGQQDRDVFCFRRLGDNHVRAIQPRRIVAQHGGIGFTRIKRAHRLVHVANRREKLVVRARQWLVYHAPAAVGRVGQALGFIDSQVLLR